MKNTTKGAALLAASLSVPGLAACSGGSSTPASYVGVCLDPYTHVRVADAYCYGNSYYSQYHRRPAWGYLPAGAAYAGVGQSMTHYHYVMNVPKGKSAVNGGLAATAGKVTKTVLKKVSEAKKSNDAKASQSSKAAAKASASSSKASASSSSSPSSKAKVRDKVKAKAQSAKAKVKAKVRSAKAKVSSRHH